jgi:arabinofuranosyltransferase
MIKKGVSKPINKNLNFYKLICVVLILLSLGLIIHRAWFNDDSFIMFRTLDNFVNGHGLTWNIYERVQAYTSPLWLFLLTPIYALTHEIYFTVTTVSVVLSALALFFLFMTVEDKKQLIIPLVALAFSNAYINFSTSGLENALLNFLCILFIFFYIKKQNIRHFYLIIFLISSLIALTRLDALLIVLPTLIYIFVTDKRKFFNKILTGLLGLSPLILWELFSLFYYGFLLPNTFYAKLNAGMPITDYLHRGLVYFVDTVTRDPVTAIGLIIGFASFLFIPKKLKPLTFGIILYFLYVIYIGGDFMSGRMYSSLFLIAMSLVAQNQKKIKDWLIVVFSAILIVIGFFAECPTPFLTTSTPISNTVYRIMDERRFDQPGTGLFRNNHFNAGIEMDSNVWSFGGYSWIAKERGTGTIEDMSALIRVSTGLLGYYGGPQLKVIDEVGLSDPLIARLPAIKNPDWRVGHLYREIPEGYKESITNPNIKITNPKIEEYNEHLKILTQRHLFSHGRLLEILRFNLGFYNYLLK